MSKFRRISWGYWDVAPARPTTVRHERLTVFEPGLPASQRRVLALLRNAGVAAGVLAILSLMIFGLAACLVLTGCFVAVSCLVAHRLRGHTRSLFATVRLGEPNRDSELIDSIRSRLARLDAERRAGLLTPVEWEAGCWSVYDQLREPLPAQPRR